MTAFKRVENVEIIELDMLITGDQELALLASNLVSRILQKEVKIINFNDIDTKRSRATIKIHLNTSNND